MWLRIAIGICLMLLLHGVVQAQALPNPELDDVRRVNAAIDKGIQHLRRIHHPIHQWGSIISDTSGYRRGITALATLAMLNCGVPVDDPILTSSLAYLRRSQDNDTYQVSLTTLVYAEARQAQDLPRIQRNVDWLVKSADRRGGKLIGWSYKASTPGDNIRRVDASNTQYALLGLYAGKISGAKIDNEVWREIRQLYRDTIKPDGPDTGFWRYVERGEAGEDRASMTMTVAGVCGLIIANMGLDDSQQKLDLKTGIAARCGQYDANDALQRGLNWIGSRFRFEINTNSSPEKGTYYHIYGLERLGRLSGQRFIGQVDWYRDGCDYLVRTQSPNGSWSKVNGIDIMIDSVGYSVSTSFALLFLSKGRTPVLMSKLAYGEAVTPASGILVEKQLEPGVIGWNRKHNDARHLTEFASKSLFKGLPLGWQTYDPRRREYPKEADILAEVGGLVQSPILYLNGHSKPLLRGQHKEVIRRYVEEGGFLLAEACCGSPEFTAGFRELMSELFPGSQLKPMSPDHPIWQSFFSVPPTEFPKLECLDRGCRTVVVFSPEPLAGYWEESKYMPLKLQVTDAVSNRGQQAFRLSANIIAYATGMEPPKQRGTFMRIAALPNQDSTPPKGFIRPAQIRLPGEPAPAPAALRNLMAHLQTAAKLDTVLEKDYGISANDDDLFKFKFIYMHGRKRFEFSEDELANLRSSLQTGGLLFADACCGKPEFDQAFREMLKKLFPTQGLVLIPLDDELYSAELNGTGTAITSVKRRDKIGDKKEEAGYSNLPPSLEGIKIDGRWAVIYSKVDIGCALENHKSSDCLGHDRDSALKLASAALLYSLKAK